MFKAWDYSVDFSAMRSMPADTPTEVKAIGEYCAKQLETSPVAETYPNTIAKFAKSFRRVRSVNGFDRVLERLYDWGDASKILWVKSVF